MHFGAFLVKCAHLERPLPAKWVIFWFLTVSNNELVQYLLTTLINAIFTFSYCVPVKILLKGLRQQLSELPEILLPLYILQYLNADIFFLKKTFTCGRWTAVILTFHF